MCWYSVSASEPFLRPLLIRLLAMLIRLLATTMSLTRLCLLHRNLDHLFFQHVPAPSPRNAVSVGRHSLIPKLPGPERIPTDGTFAAQRVETLPGGLRPRPLSNLLPLPNRTAASLPRCFVMRLQSCFRLLRLLPEPCCYSPKRELRLLRSRRLRLHCSRCLLCPSPPSCTVACGASLLLK